MRDRGEMGIGIDWQEWVRRWDRMQERYVVARTERFELVAGLVRDTQEAGGAVIDLGCGTGSLSCVVAEHCPSATITGLDMDPTLLQLARARTSHLGGRVSLVQADLRRGDWVARVPRPACAVVSATALHWLSEEHLSALYARISEVLRPGGLFLNADHVSSDSPVIQASWEAQRARTREAETPRDSEDWEGFWKSYLDALGPEAAADREAILGEWEGVEEGLPLGWHIHALRQSGFEAVDCFWRCGCDAIYGGIRREGKSPFS
jgi:ubiquinone/menaquinone biosynthesis C-methylase UbiE